MSYEQRKSFNLVILFFFQINCNIKYSLFRLKNRSGVWWCYYDGGVWVWVPCACVWRESRGPLKNSLSNAAISLVQTRSAAPPWPWVAKEKFYFIFLNNLYYIKVNNSYYIKPNNKYYIKLNRSTNIFRQRMS